MDNTRPIIAQILSLASDILVVATFTFHVAPRSDILFQTGNPAVQVKEQALQVLETLAFPTS